MSIRSGLPVDRPPQVEPLDDRARTKIEVLIDERADLLVGDLPGAERLDVERDRTRDPDHVRDLYLEPIGEPGLHDVLCDVARRVRGGAIDLRRVFAAERAAAVTRVSAIGIDDDLPSGGSGVSRTAKPNIIP